MILIGIYFGFPLQDGMQPSDNVSHSPDGLYPSLGYYAPSGLTRIVSFTRWVTSITGILSPFGVYENCIIQQMGYTYH